MPTAAAAVMPAGCAADVDGLSDGVLSLSIVSTNVSAASVRRGTCLLDDGRPAIDGPTVADGQAGGPGDADG